ncbi:MAG: hypothetical protein U9Q19_07105 [Pseudomonadota bacterium]|nr:hypothetical protein [Pseudomonadota bacterium]
MSRCFIIIVFIVWVPLSYGQPPTQVPHDISDSELDQRLKFIETRLVGLNPKASYWQYGWTGFYAMTAAGQAVLAIDEDDNDDQTSYIVGAVKSAGGLAQMLIKPLPAVKSFGRFHSMPSQTRAERMLKLEQGEALLHENANRALQRYGWKRHIIGIAANLLGGAVIAAYGDSTDAATSTVLGIAVSEAAIWTEPARAVTDLDDYRNNFRDVQRTSARNWRLVPMSGGVALRLSFD